MKRIVSFLITALLAISLIGCKKYTVKIVGPDTVEKGQTITLEVETNYRNPIVEWSSSNDLIADVDQDGNVTGVEVGTVTISVEVEKVGSTKYDIEVVAPALPEYTPVQLQNLLKNTNATYSESNHGYVKIEANTGTEQLTAELIYNFADEEIESLMYKLSGAETAHVYVKTGYAYMLIDESKSKSPMTQTEHNLIIQSYGFNKFTEKATGFYEEPEFFASLSFVEKSGNTLIYNLDLSEYNGLEFDTAGKDEIKLKVTFDNGAAVKVEVEITEDTAVSSVIVQYLGTAVQTITYPTDLDSYME